MSRVDAGSQSDPKPLKLTKRQREILEFLVRPPEGEDGELVSEHGQWWFGLERTGWRAVKVLIQHALIKTEYDERGYQLWVATPDAARVLADPAYIPMIDRAIATGQPVFE